MRGHVHLLSLAVLAAAGSASPAHAGELVVPDTVLTLRLDLPVALAIAGDGDDGWFQLIGGVASLRAGGLFEAELAADFWFNPCVSGPSFTARGGVAPAITRRGRWDLRAPLHLGFMYSPLSGGGCEYVGDERLFAPLVAAGLEATRWDSRGVTLRLLFFGGAQSHEGSMDEREWRPLVGGTLSLGLALPI